MTDYLIDRYNERIEAARIVKEQALAAALDAYNYAHIEAIARWQAATLAASAELQRDMKARNEAYVMGPPPSSLPPAPEGEPYYEEDEPVGQESRAQMERAEQVEEAA